jgi:hypothetical protein
MLDPLFLRAQDEEGAATEFLRAADSGLVGERLAVMHKLAASC